MPAKAAAANGKATKSMPSAVAASMIAWICGEYWDVFPYGALKTEVLEKRRAPRADTRYIIMRYKLFSKDFATNVFRVKEESSLDLEGSFF